MVEFLNDCVRQFGGMYYSKRQVVKSKGLNYYLLVFQTVRKEYCKLELFFNDVEIFPINTRSSNRLQCSNSFNDDKNIFTEVFDYIEIFNNFKEINDARLKSVTSQSLGKLFDVLSRKIEDDVNNGLLETTNVPIGKVKIYWQPVFTVIVNYLDNGSYAKPLVYRIGEEFNPINEDHKSILNFLNKYFEGFNNNLGRCLDA